MNAKRYKPELNIHLHPAWSGILKSSCRLQVQIPKICEICRTKWYCSVDLESMAGGTVPCFHRHISKFAPQLMTGVVKPFSAASREDELRHTIVSNKLS